MTGSELKQLRKELGLSLAEAARQVEVSVRTWARWEASDEGAPPGAVKLFRIVNGLEKPKR
jgi:transcriptional regulator with XRE-family HTH domain